jgi:hypothetical protein
MELSTNEYIDLQNRVNNILNGNYDKQTKHVLATRLENSSLLMKFLRSIQYDSISDKYKDLITKVCDCLEY